MSFPRLAVPDRQPRSAAVPSQSPATRWFNAAAFAECARIAVVYGFDLAWEDDDTGRTLLLLGADSPAEMTMRLAWSDLDGSRIEATASRVLRWMLERGAYWTGREIDWLALRAAVLENEGTN